MNVIVDIIINKENKKENKNKQVSGKQGYGNYYQVSF